jgi:hypothetical protein
MSVTINACYSMRNVPRWRNLKHIDNVTTIEYADGQVFVDILKVCQYVLFFNKGLYIIFSVFSHALYNFSQKEILLFTVFGHMCATV